MACYKRRDLQSKFGACAALLNQRLAIFVLDADSKSSLRGPLCKINYSISYSKQILLQIIDELLHRKLPFKRIFRYRVNA